MRLTNTSGEQRRIHDLQAGRGVTVEAGQVGDFAEVTAIDLQRDFPSDWAPAGVEQANPKELSDER